MFWEKVKAVFGEAKAKWEETTTKLTKDVAISMGVIYVNKKINRFAEVLEVKLNQGRANLTIKLKGETDSIGISLNYTLEENILHVADVQTNKEWLNGLAEVFKEKYSTINLSDFGIEKNGQKAKLIELVLG